jgi:hypothetical protein
LRPDDDPRLIAKNCWRARARDFFWFEFDHHFDHNFDHSISINSVTFGDDFSVTFGDDFSVTFDDDF